MNYRVTWLVDQNNRNCFDKTPKMAITAAILKMYLKRILLKRKTNLLDI